MTINQDYALKVLNQESERIYHLIKSQKEHLCFAQCPAFEEVVDTQLYGFSKQVAYAVSIGVIDEATGQKMLAQLDGTLNDVYSEIFEEGHFYHVEGMHHDKEEN